MKACDICERNRRCNTFDRRRGDACRDFTGPTVKREETKEKENRKK